MLRLSARRHAAASLGSISHGPSSIPPEILFKYVTSGQLKPSPLIPIRESTPRQQWIDDSALRLRHNNLAPAPIEDGLQVPSAYKKDRNVRKASNPAKSGLISRRGQTLSRSRVDGLERNGAAPQRGKQNVVEVAETQSSMEEGTLFPKQGMRSINNLPRTRIHSQVPAVGQAKGRKRDSRGRIVEANPPPKIPSATESDETDGLFARIPFKNNEQASLVRRFNEALAKASRAMYNDDCRKHLWEEYTKLKERFPESLRHFPKTAWRKLWKIQASLRPTDTQRLDSLETLISDMEGNSSYSIRVEKMILHLEKEFASGRESEALVEWQSHCQGYSQFRQHMHSEMGIESHKWKEWLELGVRLHALAGDTDQASHITQQILRRYRTCDPRFIFVQILSFNHWPDTVLHRRAWILYLQLRQLPKFSLCLDDFQGLFHSFLRAGQKRCALAVLKDMTRLDIADETLTTTVLECVKALHESCTTEQELERHSISALSVVPTRLQTKALYTSWLAQICKHGSGDDMARVIELMFERGLMPTANHLDGLLRAWLQSKDPHAAVKGEILAWSMISAFQDPKEIDLAKYLRLSRLIADSKAGTRTAYDPRMFTSRPISKATASTFIRLARHYAETGHTDHARDVVALFMSTGIDPTRRQLRAILRIYINTGYFSRAWQFFLECLANEKLPVDLATYSTLWQGLGQQLHRRLFQPKNLRTTVDGIPCGRELFLHMRDFIRAHGPISTVPRTRAFKRASLPKNTIPLPEAIKLLDRIVRAFALSKDTFGALLAMRTLYRDLRITPSVNTIVTILQHAAHEAMVSECKIQNRPQDVNEYMPMSMQVLASLYQFSDPTAPKEKTEAVKELLQPSIQRKGESLLKLLETFMARIMQGNFSNVQIMAKFREAKESMGLLPRNEGDQDLTNGNFGATPAFA